MKKILIVLLTVVVVLVIGICISKRVRVIQKKYEEFTKDDDE